MNDKDWKVMRVRRLELSGLELVRAPSGVSLPALLRSPLRAASCFCLLLPRPTEDRFRWGV